MSTQPSVMRSDPFLLSAPTTGGADVRTFWMLLCPAGAVCLALYFANQSWAAIALGAASFTLAVVIAPQVGLYAYFAWQALDAAVVTGHYDVFSPAKAFAPFLLLLFLFRVGRSGTPMQVSRPFVVTMLIFGTYGLVTSVAAIQPLAALRYSGQIIVQALLLVMAVHLLDRREYVLRLMLATVLGGVVAASLMWITGGVSRQFTRGTLGEFANPNTTALALTISLAAIPAAWAYTRRKVYYLFYLAATPLLVGAILMTGSRSAVVAVLAAFVLGVALARGAGLFKRVIVAVACTVAVVYIAVVVVQSGMLDAKSRDRIEEFVRARGDVGDARLDIWNLGLQTYTEAPVIGAGFGNAAFALERNRGWYRDMHSSYLSVLVDGGAIGLMLFGYGLWQLFRRVRGIRVSAAAIPASIMLFLLLASALTHTIHFTKWFWVPATICLLLAEQAAREQMRARATQALNNENPLAMPVAATRSSQAAPRQHNGGQP